MTPEPSFVEDAGPGPAFTKTDAGPPGVDAGPSRREPTAEELELLFGGDALFERLGRTLGEIPGDLPSVEQRLGIGRACARTERREVFVIEERRTRPNGKPIESDADVPRAVLGGCSDSDRARADVMAVTVSEAARRPGGDPLRLTPIEVMAWDDTTGRFHFYEFSPGAVTRLEQDDRGQVEERTFSSIAGFTRRPAASGRCFSCHIHGTVVMNELDRPWPSWLSEVNPFAKHRWSGATGDVVSFAEQRAPAYDLQRTIESAIARQVERLSDIELRRLGQQSIFCESQVQWRTRHVGLFLDPEVLENEATALAFPTLDPAVRLPAVTPSRGFFDRTVERAFLAREWLRPNTALALRVFDDTHDVFSVARCQLATAVASTPGAGFDAAVATALRQAMAAEPASPRKDYLLALLGDTPLTTQVRAAYVREARARVAQAAAGTQTPEGRMGLEAEVRRRILAARALYPGDEHPLPFVPLD